MKNKGLICQVIFKIEGGNLNFHKLRKIYNKEAFNALEMTTDSVEAMFENQKVEMEDGYIFVDYQFNFNAVFHENFDINQKDVCDCGAELTDNEVLYSKSCAKCL